MSAPKCSTAELLRMDTMQLLALFNTLEAPSIEEMDGEYTARLLKQPSWLAAVVGNVSVYNPLMPGKWLCKAFRPVNGGRGRGYNLFRHFGRPVQRYPMQTLIAPSRYDGKPVYQLVYRAYHSMCGAIHMADEVRRLETGLYLGIGTYGFSDGQRMVPCPFLLTGPVAPYRGDFGGEGGSFDLGRGSASLKAGPLTGRIVAVSLATFTHILKPFLRF